MLASLQSTLFKALLLVNLDARPLTIMHIDREPKAAGSRSYRAAEQRMGRAEQMFKNDYEQLRAEYAVKCLAAMLANPGRVHGTIDDMVTQADAVAQAMLDRLGIVNPDTVQSS